MNEPQRFRGAIYAVALAFHAQARIVPKLLVRIGRRVGDRVIRHLDDQREQRHSEAL